MSNDNKTPAAALPDIESWSKGYKSGYARAVADLAARQPVGESPVAEVIQNPTGHVAIVFAAGKTMLDHVGAKFYTARPAQAVDLAPASIPDTPEVRDILGRPNFWCSPWANILRRRGDEIPCKSEEEQAAVIRFMLNHYLAHGEGWAEAAEAEIQAIRYQVVPSG